MYLEHQAPGNEYCLGVKSRALQAACVLVHAEEAVIWLFCTQPFCSPRGLSQPAGGEKEGDRNNNITLCRLDLNALIRNIKKFLSKTSSNYPKTKLAQTDQQCKEESENSCIIY